MTDAALDLSGEIARYRPMLYRLALLQLHDRAAADDVAQETILAALEGASGFRAQSSLKTWLFAILRHKMIDSLRAGAKRVRLPADDANAELDITGFNTLFDSEDCWAAPKDVWTDPETVVERKAFFRVLEACLTKLPPRTARAFLMREWLELEPEEVSAELKVSAGNLRVLLYRARMKLRLCLDLGWNRA
ncbi:MAG: sigma-70 family RNA polymerase sigma factor [Methyloceanibacter sp.]|jgi:RNA polymerase sigma-70 factor (ECF subfamily)